jgi:hypothetical protein
VLPQEERWARIGPTKKSWLTHIPKAGLCLSAFVIITNRENEILVGLPRDHKAWPEAGGFPRRHARNLEKRGELLLPATHLLMEESPERAAVRIAQRWTGYPNAKPSFVMAQSHLRPSKLWNKGKKNTRLNHWDICFVYSMRVDQLPRKIRPWWTEMRFENPKKIQRTNLGRGHKDVLREAGFLISKKK